MDAEAKSAPRPPSPSVTMAVSLRGTGPEEPAGGCKTAQDRETVSTTSGLSAEGGADAVPEVLHQSPPDSGPTSTRHVAGVEVPFWGAGSVKLKRSGTAASGVQVGEDVG